MTDLSEFIGWLGFSLGMFISVPQVVKSMRTKSTLGVSKLTYVLLLLACCCYATRAVVIKEMIFIVSNAFQIIIAGTMLYLMKRYKFHSVNLGKHWEFKKKETYNNNIP